MEARMAKAKSEAEGQAGDAPAAGGGKGKRIVLIVLVLLLLGGGGGAAWFFLMRKPEVPDATAEAKRPRLPPVFEKLEPCVVNLADRGRSLQVGLELRVVDPKVQAEVKKLVPEIRNGILLVLSGKRAEEISSAEGKMRLQLEIRQAANRALGIDLVLPPAPLQAPAEGADPAEVERQRAEFDKLVEASKASLAKAEAQGVTDVLFTSFVIQ
ncbi:MAG: flagellar basal body-associated protein FliL [Pseudomonadota bacterium]